MGVRFEPRTNRTACSRATDSAAALQVAKISLSFYGYLEKELQFIPLKGYSELKEYHLICVGCW